MQFLGKNISGPFTIPSGIVMTDARIIERIAQDMPEVGVITTKSIGLAPREGYREPILTQHSPGSFMNAVGLTNPGAKEFAEKLKKIRIPKDRFLLTSIFGKDADEFAEVAKMLAPYSDGLELNLSCPHVRGHGMAIGQDPEQVRMITEAVKQAVDIPVVPKLTPNVPDITVIAEAAVAGGADAICAINTVGPGKHTVDDMPVLTNEKGGISGKEVRSTGLKCIAAIAKTGLPVIGCGGISDADDVRAYKEAGATIFGIGSALVELSTAEIAKYFHALNKDLNAGTNTSADILKQTDMEMHKYTVVENRRKAKDFSLLVLDKSIAIKPGQFVFVWIPGIGEKPFSVLDNDPAILAILSIGKCTEKLVNMEEGTQLYVRGPYGLPVEVPDNTTPVLVSGGTGFAALYKLARTCKNAEVFLGARDKDHLFYVEEARECANVHVSTDDGSVGHKGFVTELLKQKLPDFKGKLIFFNCGPPLMIEAATKIERELAPDAMILNSIDYVTKCGVGLCGSCVTPRGERSCVDGPFLQN